MSRKQSAEARTATRAAASNEIQKLRDENRRLKQVVAQASRQLRQLVLAKGTGRRLSPRAFGLKQARPAGSGGMRLRVWGDGPIGAKGQIGRGPKLRVWGAGPISAKGGRRRIA